MIEGLVSALTNDQPDLLVPALLALSLTITAVWLFGGRFWALLYLATIPFLNWSFGVIHSIVLVAPNATFPDGVSVHPLVLVTGLVFVLRDFVQRRIGHRVLIVMVLAISWAFFYAWPVIAIASGLAFAVSEAADWMVYTFTKYRLSTRILLSSALASPIDTTIFLYGADLALQLNPEINASAGTMLHPVNWTIFALGKMVGAVAVSWMIRRDEDAAALRNMAAA
ncbi:MAG: hypothetical protein RLO80_01525 [Hyphomonas sp.]